MTHLDEITLRIDHRHARELSQLVKRITFAHFIELSVDEDEAYLMADAVIALRQALSNAGYSPR